MDTSMQVRHSCLVHGTFGGVDRSALWTVSVRACPLIAAGLTCVASVWHVCWLVRVNGTL